MGAAFEQADAVMGAASDEIMGMLIAEGKDHIDEKQEEEKKTAEEAADKKEGTGRKTASQKRRKERAGRAHKRYRGSCEHASRWCRQRSSGQQEIKDMMNKLKLIEDDVKGAAVDQGI